MAYPSSYATKLSQRHKSKLKFFVVFFKKSPSQTAPTTQRKIVAAYSSTLGPDHFAWLFCGDLHPSPEEMLSV